jgi:transposase-like protein
LVVVAMAVTGFTPEKEATILEALRERPSFAAACRKARISRPTFYKWRREIPGFEERVIAARNEGLDALEDALATRGAKNDTTAAIFLLKSHRRDVYGDKIDHTHQGRIRHEHIDLSIYTDDELDQLEALRRKAEAGQVDG